MNLENGTEAAHSFSGNICFGIVSWQVEYSVKKKVSDFPVISDLHEIVSAMLRV